MGTRSHRLRHTAAITVLSAALGALGEGCSEPTTLVWQLTDFRILGVKADPPEAARGSDVTLTLVTADVRERPIQVVWLLCRAGVTGAGGGVSFDPGMMQGDSPCTLVTNPDLPFPIPDTRTQVRVRIPETGGVPDGNGRDRLTVFGFACAGGTIAAPAEGESLPRCEGEGARGWQFLRSLYVQPAMSLNPPNRNPVLTAVRFGAAGSLVPLTAETPAVVPRCTESMAEDCPKYVFEVDYSEDSREPFSVYDAVDEETEMRTERITTGFVIEGGTLNSGFRTDSEVEPMSRMDNEWSAPAEPGDYRLFLYATDGRGGFEATTRTVRVE